MKTGNIILVTNPFYWKAPLSSLLYWIMRQVIGQVHHCALYWRNDAGEFIVEAIGKGVICTEIEIWRRRWPNRITRVLPLECDPKGFTQHLGKRYDRFSFLVACLWKMVFAHWIGRPRSQASDKLYCLELAAGAHGHPDAHCILMSEFLAAYDGRTIGV